ncbi:MAG: hypothetical protein LBJ35_07955 [Spirochaetaceae bacterium]|jgi:hypothetical protein|nr:hypothetical protein [Spirochaetaceae bacterium]
MAMQPIDLQILFSQLETVAKDTSAQKDGLTLRGAINAAAIEKKSEEKSHSINEMHDGGEELESLSSYENQNSQKRNSKKKPQNNGDAKNEKQQAFRDPSLGNFIDLTG